MSDVSVSFDVSPSTDPDVYPSFTVLRWYGRTDAVGEGMRDSFCGKCDPRKLKEITIPPLVKDGVLVNCKCCTNTATSSAISCSLLWSSTFASRLNKRC